MSRIRHIGVPCAAYSILILTSIAHAAAPSVRTVSVRGLQIAGKTTLVFDGTDLLPNPRVLMSVPVAAQTVKPNATATRVEIEVTLDDKTTPGFYNLHLANDGGVSERLVVALDRLPQTPFAAKVESLPVALHGTIAGSAVLRTTFPGKAGQAVLCEVEAQRLGGKLRPVLHLYDAEGKHLAWSLPAQQLRGDARLAATLPAEGEYTLTLNDLQYAAAAPNFFRLKLGQWQYADAAFPAAVERGKTAPLRLLGNGPPDKVVSVFGGDASHQPAAWPDANSASGPAPAVLVSDVPEYVEQAGESMQEIATAPAGISGRLLAAGEVDTYRLKVQPEAKIKFELFAARLGAPLDTVLELRRENNAVLVTSDDSPGTTDSLVDYTVPKDVETLVVAIRDSHGRGGEQCAYRLVVTPASAQPAADFRLSFEQDRLSVPQQGRQVVKVRAERLGYMGPIRLEFGGLPSGVAVEGGEIPANANAKLLTLSGSAEGLGQLLTSLRGTAAGDGASPKTRTARGEGDVVGQFQPWLANELAVALASRSGIGFDCDALPASDAKAVLGGKLQLPVKCVRPVGFDGPVRLTLLTGQNAPQLNGKDDPNRTLRAESAQPVEIPADAKATAAWDAKLAADKVLADAETMLAAALKAFAAAETAGGAALEAATKAKTDAEAKVADAKQKQAAAAEAASAASAAAKNDLSYSLLVPADLPAGTVELAVRAELLSRDKQKVLLALCTPVRVLPVFNPLKLAYAGPPKAQAKLDAKTGATLKVAGKIERLEGVAADVTVTAIGLPAGVAVPRVVVKAGQTDYELEFKFPANTPPGELAGIKLFATCKMTPQSPVDIRSEEITVPVEILPPDA